MGDGLQVEAQLEAALNQIADENGEEDGTIFVITLASEMLNQT